MDLLLHAGEHADPGLDPLVLVLAVAVGLAVTTAAGYWFHVRS